MPSDLPPGDDIGAPELPRLCPDHQRVINNATRLQHVGDDDVQRAAESKARSCRDCIALNGWRLS